MFALIMAGGRGSRLGMGEKPLATIDGQPMISYVIDAFTGAGCEAVVVTSTMTPFTQNWCRAHAIPFFTASGKGYIEDIAEVIHEMELHRPLFVSVCDLPCLTARTIIGVRDAYLRSGKPACSTWIAEDLCREHGCRTAYTEEIDHVRAVPVGLNIIDGGLIDKEQDELRLLLDRPGLAFNINTRDELLTVQRYLREERRRTHP